MSKKYIVINDDSEKEKGKENEGCASRIENTVGVGMFLVFIYFIVKACSN